VIFLVVGSAACVHDDLARLPVRPDQVVALNRQIRALPAAPHYGATVHPEKAQEFSRDGVTLVGTKPLPGVDVVWDGRPTFRHGTSALYACGWIMDPEPPSMIVLAGCPIDETPHFYDDTSALGDSLSAYRHFWHEALPLVKNRVFSMSGWTRDLLGSPPAT